MAIFEALVGAALAANRLFLKPYKQTGIVELDKPYSLCVTQQASNILTSWWTFTVIIDGVEVFQELVNLGEWVLNGHPPFEKDAAFHGHRFRVRIESIQLPRPPWGWGRMSAILVKLLQEDKVTAEIDTGF